MTGSRDELEDRLRRVLDQAAREMPIPPATWRGPTPSSRRRRLPRPDRGGLAALASLTVAVLVAIVALGGLHGRDAGPTTPAVGGPPPAPPPVAFEPHLSRAESRYVGGAWRTTAARDRACRASRGAELTTGSPSPGLRAMFAVLRGPTTSAAGLGDMLRWTPGAQLYTNQIRRARSAFGANFYVLAAGNVSRQRGVPARCGREQVAALTHTLSHASSPRRDQILAAQRRYLAYLRYSAVHAEGICAGYRSVPGGREALECSTVANIQRWGVLVDASVYLDHAAVFWTLVPDGVTTVTLTFTPTGGSPARTVRTTVRPVDNVVVAKEPFDPATESGFPSTILLRGADGHVIRRIAVTPGMPTLCGYGC